MKSLARVNKLNFKDFLPIRALALPALLRMTEEFEEKK